MRKILLSSLFLLQFSFSFAQLDVHQFKKFQIGVMYDKTTVVGLYTLMNPYTGEIIIDQSDYKINTNAEFKLLQSTKDYVFTGNYEGIIYLLGRIASLGQKKELFNDFDTYLDPLSAGECHNVKLFSGPGYNEVARFSNNHIADFTTSKVIKESPVFFGLNLSLRTLGFPPRYTFYQTEKPANYYLTSQMAATWKILYGINAGIRSNLGKYAALFVIGGVNTGINSKKSTAIQLKYSPFINTNIFMGKKMGFYVGFYWEMMKGKDKTQTFNPSNLVGGGASYTDQTLTIKTSESQLQLKVGIYLTAKKESSL